jgi:hypothetical protein
MFGGVPMESLSKVLHGLAIIQELPQVLRGTLDGDETPIKEGIVVRCARAGEPLRNAVLFAEPLDWPGIHLYPDANQHDSLGSEDLKH